jgi:hypothetical protein
LHDRLQQRKEIDKEAGCNIPLLIKNFCSIAAGAQYIKVHRTPKPSVTNPSKGNVGLSKPIFSANAFGTGTSAAAKSMPGKALRKSGTPISAHCAREGMPPVSLESVHIKMIFFMM